MSLSILSFKLHISFEVKKKKKSIHYYLLLTERKVTRGGREGVPRGRKTADGDRIQPGNQEAGVFAECLFTEQQGLCQASYLSHHG